MKFCLEAFRMLNVITINIIYTLDDIETNYIWVNGKNAFLHSICSLNRFVLLSNDPYELNWTELKRHLTLIRHSIETIYLILMKFFNLKMYLRFHSVYLEFMFFFYFPSKLPIISRICVRAYSLDRSYQMRILILFNWIEISISNLLWLSRFSVLGKIK